jgi:outer membrane protein assembly factor BamB
LQSGVVIAHRDSDGAEAWHVDLKADQPVALEGKALLVAAGEAIHALASDTGAVLWRVPTGTLTAPMLAQDGWIIAASGDTLSAFRSEDGSKVWTRETGPLHVKPTIEADNLYVPLDDGRLLALNLQTGTDRWVRRLTVQPTSAVGAPPPALSEVLAFPDRLFVGAADRKFRCLNASNGALMWRFPIGVVLRGRPAGDASRVYTTSMDNVVRAFDRRSGRLLWQPSVPFRPTSGPVLIDTMIVVPGAASEVRAFDTSGHPTAQIKLEETLAIPPAFDQSGGGTLMAAVTGSLNSQWKLLLYEQSRALDVVPLKELPGEVVAVSPPVQKA